MLPIRSMDIRAEVQRLKDKGVVFTIEPTDAGTVTIAIFSDTCGISSRSIR